MLGYHDYFQPFVEPEITTKKMGKQLQQHKKATKI